MFAAFPVVVHLSAKLECRIERGGTDTKSNSGCLIMLCEVKAGAPFIPGQLGLSSSSTSILKSSKFFFFAILSIHFVSVGHISIACQ